jgi:hypothetical protein
MFMRSSRSPRWTLRRRMLATPDHPVEPPFGYGWRESVTGVLDTAALVAVMNAL